MTITSCARIATAIAALAAGPALAAPPVWLVEDDDSAVYMIGTIHLMRADGVWRTQAFETAFAEADSVWLEILQTGESEDLGALVLRHAISSGAPLSEVLSEDDLALLEDALGTYGIPLESMEGMRPWFVAMQLATMPLLEAGFDPALSLDLIIESEARAAGKDLYAFETASEQIGMLSGLSQEVQVEMLRQTLEEIAEAGDALVAQVDAWIEGDMVALEAALADSYAAAPEFYEAMFTERNIGFADDIEDILAGEGTTLVAVGLGHFVGAGSIPEILEARGYPVRVLE